MEHISKRSVATSKPFRFLVGPDKQEFTIHSALVAHQSPVLSALVQGGFKESAEICVAWDDIDETTFTSFWQSAYTGDYDTPVSPTEPVASLVGEPSSEDKPADGEASSEEAVPEEAVLEEAVPEEPVPKEDILAGQWERSLAKRQRKKKRKQKREMLWNDFQHSWSMGPAQVEDGVDCIEALPEARPNVFIHHARVYILADRYGVIRLMRISFDKLHRALAELKVDEHSLVGVVELVRFCFEELVPERLKELMVHFVACHVEECWKIEEFQEILEKHGNFSRAVVGYMLLRLD